MKILIFLFVTSVSAQDLNETSETINRGSFPDFLKIKAPGYALFFDGNRDYFYAECRCWQNHMENVTTSAWIYLHKERKENSGDMNILGHNEGSRMYVNHRGHLVGRHGSWLNHYDVDCSDSYKIKRKSLNDGKWHHVAMTVNQTHLVTYIDNAVASLCKKVISKQRVNYETTFRNNRLYLGAYHPDVQSNTLAFLVRKYAFSYFLILI